MLAAPSRTLAVGARARAVLTRFPKRWGHVVILLDDHITTFSALDEDAWQEMNALALTAARVLERSLAPVRCYVASLGSSRELPMTSSHLHLHVIPLYDVEDRPREILSWSTGLYQGTEAEWDALEARLKRAWTS